MDTRFFKRPICFLLMLVMLLGMMPATAFAAEEADNGFAGKTLSILGDSISTYTGISNNTSDNTTIGSNAVYYTAGKLGVYQSDTWWQQAIDRLGLELLVNNSWSGSRIFTTGANAAPAYLDRCVQLHNSAGEEPDIIAVYLGTNDFTATPTKLGTAAAIDYDTLITDNGDSFTYATPATVCESYAIMLHKITQRYPDAEVYCFTLLPRINQTAANVTLAQTFNESIAQISEEFDAYLVDLYGDSGIRADEHFKFFVADNNLHPGPAGMDALTGCFVSSVLENSRYFDDAPYSVSYELNNVRVNEGTAYAAEGGKPFACTLTVPADYTLAVTVTMDGEDITKTCCQDGKITINSVTGDISIRASAMAPAIPAESYRWEYNGTGLSAVDGENTLTRKAGSVQNGVHTKGQYQLSKKINLRHDRPWTIEWKSSGTWVGRSGGSGVLLFAQGSASNTNNASFLYRRPNTDFIGLGYYDGTYHNYGVVLSGRGLDLTKEHTCLLENRIAEDGTNMVWLLIDGEEMGPLIQYYEGGTNKNTTSDWVSGKDFSFNYMGTSAHPLGYCSIDYIQVEECTHLFQDGTCIGCGECRPNLESYRGKVISVLGDSISTFAGYIPVADGFNLEHLPRYPQDNLLTDVNETWWMQVIEGLGAKLGINDSWRGATCSGAAPVTTGTTGENAAMCNLTRIENLGSNGTPDVILFYGGTNDLAHVAKVGSFDPATAPTAVDLTTKKWDNLADGFVHTLLRLRHFYPEAQIVCLLPTYTASYYSDEKLAQGNAVLAAICAHYGISFVDLRESGVTAAHLPDGIHPGEEGMDLISAAVIDLMLGDCPLTSGENLVHPVTHALSGAASSKGHIKGISHGKPFRADITGENLTVTVTMGGVDITDACYADGSIAIESVTGPLVITASGETAPEHAAYLQALPAHFCSETNLWTVLERNEAYYTASGWGTHSSGKVRSVTIPVNAGDRICATSFGAAGTNGSSMNGIRVTWFGPEKAMTSMSADKVYTEFTENGFLTAPAGAVAVNIPMWTADDSNELYLLGLDHAYENGTCIGCGAAQPGIVILTQPVPDDAAIGEKATLSVKAQGEGLRYQWYYRDAGKTEFTRSTVQKSTYILTVKATNANRELYCVITDSKGNQAVTDTVKLLAPLTQELKILRQPQPAQAAIGETATVTMEVQGVGLRYQWYYRDLPNGSLTKSTITSGSYSLTVKATNANRELYCVITDAHGNQVVTDTVKLLAPLAQELKILRQPQPAQAAIGETATVTMEVQGVGLRYQWYYRDLPNGSLTKSTITSGSYSLTVKPTNADRELYCVITDAHGNQIVTDTVKLLAPPVQELKITQQPVSDDAIIGEVATVSVEAQGVDLHYQWYYRDLPNGSLTKSTVTSSVYRMTVKPINAKRELYCVITDGHGNQVVTDTVALRTDEVLPVYYPTLSDALAGTNALLSAEDAVAQVRKDSGDTVITLLQDTTLTESLVTAADVVLDLNGHTVSSAVHPMLRVESGACTLRNGSLLLSGDGTGTEKAPTVAITAASGTALEISKATITVTDPANGTVNGIITEADSTLMLTETDITVTSGKSLGNIGVYTMGHAVLRDCSVIAEADYTGAGNKYTSYSRGIYNKGTLALYDCYVWGAHSGVTATGPVYVNGGTYEGYGHGAFYLAAAGQTSYFCNAAFNWAAMRPGTVADSVAGTNNSAFYIGQCSNATTYFDGCSFKSNSADKSYCLTLRSSGGEANNTAYVSNSTFKGYARYAYRIGNAKNTKNLLIYSGVGNSYGIRVFNYTAKGFYTEDSYAQTIADMAPSFSLYNP